MEHLDRARSPDSDGYILLEVIISTAIAASILYLLTTSLAALGRSQDKAASVAESLSTAVFDDALLRAVFAGVRPDYADGPNAFTGDQRHLTGSTWFAEGELAAPMQVKFNLIEESAGFRLELQIGDETRTVLESITGRASFEYVGFNDIAANEWTSREQPDPQSAIIRFSKYCHTVPRQVRLIIEDTDGNTVLRSYSLSSNKWPMPRPGDTGVLGPF